MPTWALRSTIRRVSAVRWAFGAMGGSPRGVARGHNIEEATRRANATLLRLLRLRLRLRRGRRRLHLDALLLVVPQHPAREFAVVDSGDDVLGAVVEGAIGDERPERALPGVDLLHDRREVVERFLKARRDLVAVSVIIEQLADEPLLRLEARGAPLQGAGRFLEVRDGDLRVAPLLRDRSQRALATDRLVENRREVLDGVPEIVEARRERLVGEEAPDRSFA